MPPDAQGEVARDFEAAQAGADARPGGLGALQVFGRESIISQDVLYRSTLCVF